MVNAGGTSANEKYLAAVQGRADADFRSSSAPPKVTADDQVDALGQRSPYYELLYPDGRPAGLPGHDSWTVWNGPVLSATRDRFGEEGGVAFAGGNNSGSIGSPATSSNNSTANTTVSSPRPGAMRHARDDANRVRVGMLSSGWGVERDMFGHH